MNTQDNFERLQPKTGSGQLGEDIACDWFRARGIPVVARNLRKRWTGEIDLLVRYRGRLHLIEVKCGRTDLSELAMRVDERKLRRMMQTLASFYDEYDLDGQALQVDLFLVQLGTGEPRVRWVKDVLPPEFLLDDELPDVW